MNMVLLCFTYAVVCVLNIALANGGRHADKIINYFESDTFKTIQNHWQPERKSFENAIALTLQQDYGLGGMNVYVSKVLDSHKISDGFYFSDNIVNLVLLDTRLQALPIIIAPEVTFALASNYLHLTTGLGRMVLNTSYVLMRNGSDMVYTASEQDTNIKSPFSFQQVHDCGQLTIIAQDCYVDGYAITSFNGNIINLGLDTFKVTNCKFSVEIFTEGVGSPPVFGPYFSKDQSIVFETMLSKPIRAELITKLQAAVYTYINTSAIFGEQLPQLRFYQNRIFKESFNYMSEIVGRFVKDVIMNSASILPLKPVEVSWNRICSNGSCGSCVRLKDITLYGLDTAYSAHIGGPIKVQSIKVAETIRFSSIQVRGKIYYEISTANGEHDFSVELQDVAVNVEMEASADSFTLLGINVIGWRNLEFSIVEVHINSYQRRVLQSFITGYLINEIPSKLSYEIESVIGKTKNENRLNVDKDKAVSEITEEKLDVPKEVDEEKPQKTEASINEKELNLHENESTDHERQMVSTKDESTMEDKTVKEVLNFSESSENNEIE